MVRESKRQNFSVEFKAKLALEAIRGTKTVNEIGREFGVYCRHHAAGNGSCRINSEKVAIRKPTKWKHWALFDTHQAYC